MTMVYFFQILSGLLTPVIAMIALYIAYQQFNVNRNKLKLELYEKRYKMYLFIKDFIEHFSINFIFSSSEFRKFNTQANECKYLFDKDINALIKNIQKNVLKILALNEQLSRSDLYPVDSKERQQFDSEKLELMKWFNDLYFDIEEYFMEYLEFKKIK